MGQGGGTDNGAGLAWAAVEVLGPCFEACCHSGSAALTGVNTPNRNTEEKTMLTGGTQPTHHMACSIMYKHIQTRAAPSSSHRWQTGC